ncbi:thioesterase family protein [Pontivivens ytuae]|uniref:Thioesterase family protein n=1 Tax=Pontivivens ytuae TaxID=2789856 RepID=A0A7S9QBL0_9RHOB|nr:thioesterase family protein [Pontivivens ytuae]QPH52850.1 thioesterase family protein [Pontivivens ytuae]
MSRPLTGHDGPYAAPFETSEQTVPPEWIDYNGHMNVAYYTMAIDRAQDELQDVLGLGEAHAKADRMGPYVLQTHMHYLGEMLEGATFHGRFLLLDHDTKRMHIWAELVSEGEVRATSELMVMNVDLDARRGAPFPDWALKRLERMKADHAAVPHPPRIGAPLGLRR